MRRPRVLHYLETLHAFPVSLYHLQFSHLLRALSCQVAKSQSRVSLFDSNKEIVFWEQCYCRWQRERHPLFHSWLRAFSTARQYRDTRRARRDQVTQEASSLSWPSGTVPCSLLVLKQRSSYSEGLHMGRRNEKQRARFPTAADDPTVLFLEKN